MNPGNYNLNVYRGDTNRWQFKLWADTAKTIPADLTGVVAQATIRGGNYVEELDCVITLPNIISISSTANESRDWPAVGVWDLQLTYPNEDVFTVLKGSCIVTQDVTYPSVAVR